MNSQSRMEDAAGRLHSAAIHLLRRLRREDESSGQRAPAFSALSVIVFRGPLSIGELARLEQVRPPSMTRIVRALEADGLARSAPSPGDRRVVIVEATERGRKLLLAGRSRRVRSLAASLENLSDADLRALERATAILERLIREQG